MAKFRLVEELDGTFKTQVLIVPETIDPYWVYVSNSLEHNFDDAKKKFDKICDFGGDVKILEEREIK